MRRCVSHSKPRLGDALPSFACDAAWVPSAPPDDASMRGRPVLVYFFSSDCPLCDEGARRIAQWVEELAPVGLVVIGAFQPRRDAVASSAAALAECERHSRIARHPCAADATGELSKRFANEWWPAYFVFDAAHRLRHYQMGNHAMDHLESVVRECALSAAPRESPG
jgi:thiol-disulfide isomerase/thioredoxin